MDNRPIQPGDFVYVYRDCCGKYVGIHFTVNSIHHDFGFCGFCMSTKQTCAMAFLSTQEANKTDIGHMPLEWLKRVPPLGELTGEYDRVPIRETEPA